MPSRGVVRRCRTTDDDARSRWRQKHQKENGGEGKLVFARLLKSINRQRDGPIQPTAERLMYSQFDNRDVASLEIAAFNDSLG